MRQSDGTPVQKQTFYASQALRFLASAEVFRHTMATRQKLMGETPGIPRRFPM
jgi:hypothetical protein